MKKSSVVVLCIFLVAISVVGTYFASQFAFANKPPQCELFGSVPTSPSSGSTANVTLSREEYDELKAFQEKYADLEELQQHIRESYYKEVDPELLMEGAKKGIFNILGDPYSVFMNPQEYTSFQESISGEFPGIGVYVSPNNEKGIEIVSPIEDTPAFAAGLKPLDIIKAVNGVEYSAKEMDEAVKNIRGPVGTDVTITIYRPSTNETFDVTITRAMIVVKVVKSEMLENEIGYLRLTQFDSHASKEFYQHMEQLIALGAKGLILDLRDNPGGSLSECIKICDMLLPDQVICSTEGRAAFTSEVFRSDKNHYGISLVVLINQGSASASEILAGAVKDNRRALLVGVKSFGKGIVQTFMPYKDGTGIKITTSEYFTPSGVNIHGIGIEPDYVVELSKEYQSLKEPTHKDDNQLQKALEVLKRQMGR